MAETKPADGPHDLAVAMQLVLGAHEMYQEILSDSLDHAGHDDLDIPAFLKRLNGALVGFKPHDTQIASLLKRYNA